MATSLLDFAMQSQRGAGGGVLGRLPTSGEMLRASVLGRGQTNPSRVNPPTGAQPTVPQAGQVDPAQQFAGPGGSHPAQVQRPNRADIGRGPQGQPTQSQRKRQAKRASAAELSRTLINVRDGQELTGPQRRMVQEVANDNVESGPGREGRTFLGRLWKTRSVFPGLSERQHRVIDQNALTTAGLTMMMSDRRGLARIGEGLQAGMAYAVGLGRAFVEDGQTEGEEIDNRRAALWATNEFERINQQNPDLGHVETWKEVAKRADVAGRTLAAEYASEAGKRIGDFPTDQNNAELREINGQQFWVSEESGTIWDLDWNKVSDIPEPEPEVNPTRLNQLEREFDKSRQDALTAAQALGDARSIRAKLETEDTVSSADQRVLANRLQQMMDAGNVRESTIEAIASSGGVQGGIQGLVGLFREGEAPAVVARDLIQAIERGAQQQRVAFEENRQTFGQRLLNVPGISEDQVRASLGVDPFARFAGGSSTPTNTPVLFPEDEEEGQ